MPPKLKKSITKTDETVVSEVINDPMKDFIKQMDKEYGKGSLMCFKDKGIVSAPCISTNSITLDIALGGKGVPKGRVTEIFGEESAGKTTLCLHIIANSQKQGGRCAIIDVENALDPSYAEKIGVDVPNLFISQPSSGEEALNMAEDCISSGLFDVIVVDSIAALVPLAEIEGNIGDSHMGLQARMIGQALRKLNPLVAKNNVCCIFTNQMREKIGVVFGNPATTPGGKAMKFYASVRMEIKKVTQLKDKSGESYGFRTRVICVKNKLAPPYRKAEFDLLFAEGISKENSIIEKAIELNIIEKKGAWLAYNGENIGQGVDKVKETLKDDSALMETLEKAIYAKLEIPIN